MIISICLLIFVCILQINFILAFILIFILLVIVKLVLRFMNIFIFIPSSDWDFREYCGHIHQSAYEERL